MLTPDDLNRLRAHAPNGLRSDEAARKLLGLDSEDNE